MTPRVPYVLDWHVILPNGPVYRHALPDPNERDQRIKDSIKAARESSQAAAIAVQGLDGIGRRFGEL